LVWQQVIIQFIESESNLTPWTCTLWWCYWYCMFLWYWDGRHKYSIYDKRY
jgi:hypothetical protein